jgi:hypothetical protein
MFAGKGLLACVGASIISYRIAMSAKGTDSTWRQPNQRDGAPRLTVRRINPRAAPRAFPSIHRPTRIQPVLGRISFVAMDIDSLALP